MNKPHEFNSQIPLRINSSNKNTSSKDMLKKMHDIYPHLEGPPIVAKLSRVQRVEAQEDYFKQLATPREISRKRWEIQEARSKDEALKMHYRDPSPPISCATKPPRKPHKICTRNGPLFFPDRERLQFANAQRAIIQEKYLTHLNAIPNAVSAD